MGLCQVGAWGCFDEFNRLEERMLSAVSQQIQTIQEALKEQGQLVGGSSSLPPALPPFLPPSFPSSLFSLLFFLLPSSLFSLPLFLPSSLPSCLFPSLRHPPPPFSPSCPRCQASHCGDRREAGESESRHGHLHHHEPWICRAVQPTRQPQTAFQKVHVRIHM